jgi:hypothetical protein
MTLNVQPKRSRHPATVTAATELACYGLTYSGVSIVLYGTRIDGP